MPQPRSFRLFLLCLVGLLLGWGRSGLAQPVTWRPVKLDSAASIEFPHDPVRGEIEGHQTIVWVGEETVYGVDIAAHVLEAAPATAARTHFYQAQANAMVQAAGGQQQQQSSFTAAGFAGLEVHYLTAGHPGSPPVKIDRIVNVNGTLYTLSYWTSVRRAKNLEYQANQRHFFESFRPGVVSRRPSLASSLLAALNTDERQNHNMLLCGTTVLLLVAGRIILHLKKS